MTEAATGVGVTTVDHEAPWSADLERGRHTTRERLPADAGPAVERTATGSHGHPSTCLVDRLGGVRAAFVERPGCGGYVSWIHAEDRLRTRRSPCRSPEQVRERSGAPGTSVRVGGGSGPTRRWRDRA